MEKVKQTINYKIVRRTSQYNKYIKWFVGCYGQNNSLLSSCGYRTEREARQSVVNTPQPLPMGNKLIYTEYREINED